ncbi:ABC transporter ATP-binding protein [Mesorhizobium sp. L-8-10]|uniref:ABC transporter ATP-binding protein n=1 Tax=Mesorhizobium sp. L-8-10 TaxID=2744523 RepID=UPI001929568F|nr:ABC transporter ATP-binding protein [Mesorhizobium sp. L-8-10]BCH29002.1 ABC transporter ATP-binding protein [Mesorhizobium sp. L-8-10]
MNDNILAIANARKSYDGRTNVVEIPSLDIRRGEFVSFLGPSGSGKTTTLMMIAGFQAPTQGSILLNGRSLVDVPPYKRNIGVVFQNYALFPHLTVAENVRYPLRMRGETKERSRRRIAHALELVGLTGMSDRYPRQLSGGQQQRVALARTLVFEPDLILLDEPLGALDKNLREHMQVELRRIHRELGVTMIYVTHDQTEAMTMSDRIAVFNRGKIEQIGAPEDVYYQPATPFVASFVGDSNIFEGRMSEGGAVSVPGLGDVDTSRHDLPAGRAVSVMMRPEIFKLRPQARTAAGANEREMVIRDSVNYGESRLIIAQSGPLSIRTRVLGVDATHIAAGDNCVIAWDPKHVHVLA